MAIIVALGFLVGSLVPPTPFAVVDQTPSKEGTIIAVGHLSNAIFVFGLLVVVVLGGAEISNKGLQLIKASTDRTA